MVSNSTLIALTFLSAIIGALGNFLAKLASKNLPAHPSAGDFFLLGIQPLSIAALVTIISGTMLWFFLLSKAPLNYILPLSTAINLSLSAFLATIFLGESLGLLKLLGLLFILVGGIFIGKS